MVDSVNLIEDLLRYILVFIIGLSVISSLTFSFINQEVFFFGNKLIGYMTLIYLIIVTMIGVVTAYLLLQRKKAGRIISMLFFGYLFIEVLITNICLGYSLMPSPLFTTGLLISLILILTK